MGHHGRVRRAQGRAARAGAAAARRRRGRRRSDGVEIAARAAVAGGRAGARAAGGVAGLVLLTGRPDPAVEVLPMPVTTVPAPTTTRSRRRAAPSYVWRPAAGKASSSAATVVGRRSPSPPELGPGDVGGGRPGLRRGGAVERRDRRYDRAATGRATTLGPGRAVVADPGDRRVVWAVTDRRRPPGRCAPSPRPGPPTVARRSRTGWRVVGSTDAGSRARPGAHGRGRGALWNIGAGRPPVVLDAAGRYLTSNRGERGLVAYVHG